MISVEGIEEVVPFGRQVVDNHPKQVNFFIIIQENFLVVTNGTVQASVGFKFSTVGIRSREQQKRRTIRDNRTG
jgi:hypothetical protein